MNKKFLFFSLSVLFFSARTALAVCPVCTVAVFAGVGFSRWLGIDDTITGIWIGGLIVSAIIWTISWFNKKNIHFKGRKILTAAFYYLIVIWPLYHYDFIGHPSNKLCGYDKLMMGIVTGSVAFIGGVLLNEYLKKKNGDKVYFPFQKVVIPVGILVVLSTAFYFICKDVQ